MVEDFNKSCPVGTAVIVTTDSGEKINTTVFAPAYEMCGSAVVYLTGISGCYDLERVIKCNL